MNKNLLLFTLAASPFILAACKGNQHTESSSSDNSARTFAQALKVASLDGCRIDAECSAGMYCFQSQCALECEEDTECSPGTACTDRGRCLGPQQSVDLDIAEEFDTSTTVVGIPDTLVRVSPGETQVLFTLQLSEPLGEHGLRYTIERDDAEEADARVYRALGEGTSVSIPISTGALSGPDTADSSIRVKLNTSLGAFNLTLTPTPTHTGHYTGTVRLANFGPTGLPLEFGVVTQPQDSALDAAERAWLVLGVSSDNPFSPLAPSKDGPKHVAVPLNYDAFLGRWVATTRHAFHLSSESAFLRDEGRVGRSLRFELESNGEGLLSGRFSDRWEGLYDARSAEGVLDIADVLFEGTLSAHRTGPTVALAELPAEAELVAVDPEFLPAPGLTSCAAVELYPQADVLVGGTNESCLGITSPAAFLAASEAAQASCSLAVAQSALGSETTTSVIKAFLDDDVDNPGGQSFAEFMNDCAAGVDGRCQASPQILCSRELLARSLFERDDDGDVSRSLVAFYQEVSREAFLGRQLAAFKTDTDTRLQWLGTTDYPAIVTSAVEDLTTRLLDEWQVGVLDAHLEVVRGYLDPSGLAVMGRGTAGAALEARRQLLTQMIQGWRGSMDALVVAASRWNELLRGADERAAKAAFVRQRMFDLYLAAGILTNLARGTGEGYQASAFGAGFSELMRETGQLNLTTTDLVFARDAEVVISSSLDAQEDNNTLLSTHKEQALAEIERAQESVQSVLADASAEALNEAELHHRMSNEINELRDDLVELCGLPIGCTASEFRSSPECQVEIEAGRCGFAIERSTGNYQAPDVNGLSNSEAAQSLFAIIRSRQETELTREQLRAHNAKASLEAASLEALSKHVNALNDQRQTLLTQLGDTLKAEDAARTASLVNLAQAASEQAQLRQSSIDDLKQDIQHWSAIRYGSESASLAARLAATGLHTAAVVSDEHAVFAQEQAAAAEELFPRVVGYAADPFHFQRAGIRMAGAATAHGFRLSAETLQAFADVTTDLRESQEGFVEAHLSSLEDRAELSDAIGEQAALAIEEELAEDERKSNAEIAALRAALEQAQAQADVEAQFKNDLLELEDRRAALKQMLEDSGELVLEIKRAELNERRSLSEYITLIQRAQLLKARLDDLEAQRQDINQLVGSPGAIFASSNRVVQAEARLARAKDKVMDWLVALEYAAVRPFIDERSQIILARNPYQLEEIGQRLSRLQSKCGGATNDNSTVLSVRRELLGIDRGLLDSVSSAELSTAERFRAVLAEGNVPVDKRIRYTTDSNIGDLVKSSTKVLSATFDINLDDFANLASTCNAKLQGVSVQLVGDVGEGRPTVSLLYDGVSQLRSCQPGITEYVDLIGRDRTAFDELTTFRLSGRAISPTSSINEWDPDISPNRSLGGLPLASQFTILINPQIGENKKLDWSQLEDIRLKLDYVYSDVFAEGQCE